MGGVDIRADRDLQTPAGLKRRIRCHFTGTVQGVGFRPFVYRLALAEGLAGFVLNRPDGVRAEVEGEVDALARFLKRVTGELPPLARIEHLARTELAPTGEEGFVIRTSTLGGSKSTLIPPDIATCEACERELFDPADRRYRYPFINCTNCGPRLTIIEDVPYDRGSTSMRAFPLCEACRCEYTDPFDRRFHAEPNACPVCGPSLTLLDATGEPLMTDDPLREAAALIREGYILAVKGLGGFHLCVDATKEMAVARLRRRKLREEKPLAIMVRNLDGAKALALIGEHEERLLTSPRRPIVLVRRREGAAVAPSVAPAMPDYGIMLPYTPLHHLLLAEGLEALVMTSANRSDEPICIDNHEAVSRLEGIADYFLVHNRAILVRCDDSIAACVGGAPRLLRRSRGHAPQPLGLPDDYPPVLALGAHLKACLCILRGRQAFFSPHVGDLETPLARDFLLENVALMQRISECIPETIACDLHPDYYTTRLAHTLASQGPEGGVNVVAVQHHHAHIAACLAENHISERVIGLAMDGTGYGSDGTVWGGEFLVADLGGFERAGHLLPFVLPGGELAVREPWRPAISLLKEALGEDWPVSAGRLEIVPEGVDSALVETLLARGINCPVTTSLGRLFDGVAAIVGRSRKMSFEGQAALGLEALARGAAAPLPWGILPGESLRLDWRPTIRALVEGRLKGRDPASLAAAFHATLIEAFTAVALEIRARTGIERAALSGGCFQNRRLLEGCLEAMTRAGLQVATHRQVPPGDGGIALGQAVVAAGRTRDRDAQTRRSR